jgi:Domain of unknown function DUF29
MSKSLYDTDFSSWTQTQAEALRAKDWAALDVEHLAEEIEDLGISIQHAIESHLERLLLHLLKLRYDPATRPRRVWRLTVVQARHEIAKLAKGGPQHHPAIYLPEAYRHARRFAAVAMDRPLADFPEACPWPIERVFDEDFFPEA